MNKRALDDKFESDRGIGALSAFALAASEENGRGHLVITAPTGGSARRHAVAGLWAHGGPEGRPAEDP